MEKVKIKSKNGQELKAEYQRNYEEWWLGKKTNRGIITKVTYYGTCVYGSVELKYDDGTRDFVYTRAFRPRKSDLKLIE